MDRETNKREKEYHLNSWQYFNISLTLYEDQILLKDYSLTPLYQSSIGGTTMPLHSSNWFTTPGTSK